MFNRCEDERWGKLNSPPQLEATQEDEQATKQTAGRHPRLCPA